MLKRSFDGATTTIRLVAGKLAAFSKTPAARVGGPVLKAGVQTAGAVHWDLDTIQHYRLDAKNGLDLQVEALAGAVAAQTASVTGEVNVIEPCDSPDVRRRSWGSFRTPGRTSSCRRRA